jgi:NAD(P)-dependent dehydrogenase (short-subunit alcohol dehydrogenase family)
MTMDYPFMVDPREFAGKRVLITGGTKGLGAAMARRFLAGGATVATTARSPSAADGPPVLFIEADVSAAAGSRKIIDRIQQEWGSVDILINNVGAGVAPSGGYESITDEVWQRMLDVNFLGAVRLDRAFVPIGTLWARLPQADDAIAYSAAKAALRAYSKGLAKAVAPRGVRVNMVSPGMFMTESAVNWIAHIAKTSGITEQAALEHLMARNGGIPLGRPGRPVEIAEMVALLASERGAFACGVDYLMDGGVLQSL